MIFKNFQLDKLNFNKFNIFLLYGENEGLKNEIIKRHFTKDFNGEIRKYDENEFLNKSEILISEFLNQSLFSSKKLIIISRATDKMVRLIDNLLGRDLIDLKIIIKSEALEKKSKLRNLFEKDKSLAIIPFYNDEVKSLLPIVNKFVAENNIKISRETINLLVDRASGSRENLKNEMEKILNYSISNKNLSFEVIERLTNLSKNYDVNEIADQFLCKNTKNVAKILNENNYSDEDCILILRTILSKSKRLLRIIEKNNKLKNIDKVIMETKPPIFWKEKDLVKQQINIWSLTKIQNLLIKVNKLELLVKKNPTISTNLVTNFILEQTQKSSN